MVSKTIQDNGELMTDFVREQLESGLRGDDKMLKPTYINDPFFKKKGPWKGRARQYMKWKERITPPEQGQRLFLPPRPVDVPNLRIEGVFHRSIRARKVSGGVVIETSGTNFGDDIERKYGSRIFRLGSKARERITAKILARMYDRWRQVGLDLTNE